MVPARALFSVACCRHDGILTPLNFIRPNQIAMAWSTESRSAKTMHTRTEAGPEVRHVHHPHADAAELRLQALKQLRILIRAAQRHSAWIEKQCGVSGAQLWILYEVGQQPGLRVGEVAERLAIHQTTASNLLESLVSRGYLVKRRDSPDQRVVNLSLSPEGEALLARAPQPARGLFAEAMAKLEGQDLSDLVRSLGAVLEAVGNLDESLGAQPFPFML
jgi:DNA-binding MarR family transcriptional regulator